MTVYTRNKDVNKLVKSLIKEGWEPFKLKDHWCLKAPNGDTQLVAFSTGDRRSAIKFVSDIRRIKRRMNDASLRSIACTTTPRNDYREY
jgi:hypothetical protein